jgi:hypothetical protein
MRSMVEGASQARCVGRLLAKYGARPAPPPPPSAVPLPRRFATEEEFACLLRDGPFEASSA